MTIQRELIEELDRRRAASLQGGGPEKIARQRGRGMMLARERLEFLFDENTFVEYGMHVEPAHREKYSDRKLPGDGVVTGMGMIMGRPVAAYSQDVTSGGGSLGRMHAQKIEALMRHASEVGVPVVAINDSGGARIQEAVEALSGYGKVFSRNVALSGLVPQIAVIAGPCAGGASYSPALMDFIIMTRKHAMMFICGPEVIKAATGEEANVEEYGSAAAHAAVSGNVHFIAEDDRHALEIASRLLSYLPSNNLQDPPHEPTEESSLAPIERFNELVPEDGRMPIDMHAVIATLVDRGDFLEIQRDWAKNILIGFGRVDGVVTGIVANNPMHKAGTLDIDTSDKGARFIRFCNAFNIPIVTLVDVPGYMPGLAQERGGIIRHGAKMLFAYAATTSPLITVILRKAYGGAYLAMCSSDMGADLVYAWPTAEIAVMGADGAVRVLHRRELAEAEDPAKLQSQLIDEYRSRFTSPYLAAANAMITDVINPSETRARVTMGLRTLLSKRVTRPPKKHGLIPL